MNLTNPLLPVSVADEISGKSLPPTRSFCSVQQESVDISALKKADLSSSILLRVYEIEGVPVETSIAFLGQQATFSQVDLLEEDSDKAIRQTLHSGPYSIKTLKLVMSEC